MMRLALCLSAALAAGAPVAAGESAFAAGFSGDFARVVLLDAGDAVRGCRATAPLDAHRLIRIERRADDGPTLTLQSALNFDVASVRGDLVVGGRRFSPPGRFSGDVWVMSLEPGAAEALMSGAPAALAYDGFVLPLPSHGLAEAVAFAARCRFG